MEKKNALKLGILSGVSLMAIFTISPANATPNRSYNQVVSDLESNNSIFGYTIDKNTIAALKSCAPFWSEPDLGSGSTVTFTTGDYEAYRSGNQSGYDTGTNMVNTYGTDTPAWEECMLSKLATNSNETTRAQVTQIVTMVTNRITSIMRPASFAQRSLKTSGLQSGASAGDPGMNNSVWGNFSYSNIDDMSAGGSNKKETDIVMGMLGFDRKFGAKLVGGVTAGYDDTRLKLTNEVRDSNTFSITPYVSHMYNDNVGSYLMLSHSWIEADNQTKDLPDYTRMMAATGFNLYQSTGKFLFSERIGYMTSRTQSDGGENRTKTTTYLNQASIAGEASMPMNVQKYVLEPYLGVGYEADTRYQRNKAMNYDPNGFTGNLGTRLAFSDRLNTDLQVSSGMGRKDIEQYTIQGNVRYTF